MKFIEKLEKLIGELVTIVFNTTNEDEDELDEIQKVILKEVGTDYIMYDNTVLNINVEKDIKSVELVNKDEDEDEDENEDGDY